MTNDDKILKILTSIDHRLQQQGRDIEDLKHGQTRLEKGQHEQGEKLVRQGEQITAQGELLKEHGQLLKEHADLLKQHGQQLDIILQGLAHANTAIKILDSKIDSAKLDLQREIKAHHKPKKVD